MRAKPALKPLAVSDAFVCQLRYILMVADDFASLSSRTSIVGEGLPRNLVRRQLCAKSCPRRANLFHDSGLAALGAAMRIADLQANRARVPD